MTGRHEDAEDRIILSLLEGEAGAEAPGAESAEERELRRAYTEVLGLLPYALDPVEPQPEVRARLMAAVAAESGRGETAGWGDGGPGRFAGSPSAPTPAPLPARDRRPGAWSLALAAGVAVLLLGASAVLSLRLRETRAEVARLTAELGEVRERERAASARGARLEEEMAAVSGRLAMVTQAGAEACPLRPVGSDPPQPLARGILYVAADHQHWFLKVTGLEPAPAKRVYQLWFITGGGPVSAGTFRTGATAEAEIGSPTMPSGIAAVAVTVEPAGGVEQPTGSMVLYGAEKMSLL